MSRGIFALILLALSSQAAASATTDQLQRLLDIGQAGQAYEIAQTAYEAESGDPAFDFLYGLAAMESGHLDRAAFALERVLIAQPGHNRARLELARAYFLLGDDQAARTEFQAVLAQDPPPNVAARIRVFLERIDARQRAARYRYGGYVAFGLGHDSNLNSATSDAVHDLPALRQVTLTDESLQTSDTFRQIEAGLDGEHRWTKRSAMFGALHLDDRHNLEHDALDTTAFGVQAGLAHTRGTDRFRFPLHYQQLNLDDAAYRHSTTLGAQWSRAWRKADEFTLFVQAGALRYPDQQARDTDLVLGGTTLTHRSAQRPALYSAGLYYGSESAREAIGSHNGRTFYGLRLGGQWSPRADHTLLGSLGLQDVRYDTTHPAFARTRSDELYQASATWIWRLRRDLAAKAALEHFNNGSNISVYGYRRTQLLFSLRRDF